MDKELRELIYKIVKDERDRLDILKYDYPPYHKQQKKIQKEINLYTIAIIRLEEGK